MNETPPFRGISSATRIPYALETDWPVGAAGFEPLHLEIRCRWKRCAGHAARWDGCRAWPTVA